MTVPNQHSERNPEHTWQRYLALMDENTHLQEQLEAALDALRRSWPGDEAESRFPEVFTHESNPALERP